MIHKPSRNITRDKTHLAIKYMLLLFGIMIVPLLSYVPKKIRRQIINMGINLSGEYTP